MQEAERWAELPQKLKQALNGGPHPKAELHTHGRTTGRCQRSSLSAHSALLNTPNAAHVLHVHAEGPCMHTQGKQHKDD